MMKSRWRQFLVLGLLLATVPAMAASLYQAEIPVISQQNLEREAAIAKALQQVLVKVSGNNGIATLSGVQMQLHRAKQLVQSYTYRRSAQHPLMLSVTFEQIAVDNLIRAFGQYFWGKQRPNLLVWLAIEDRRGTHVAASNEPNALRHAATKLLLESSASRGLVTTLPALDIEDLQKISTQDIAMQHASRVLAASSRYGAKDVLMVSIVNLGQRWVGQWTLYYQNQPLVWQIKADNLAGVISQGINNVTDAIVARVATATNEQTVHSTELSVSGVKSVADYVKILQLLRRLEGVSEVQVANVKDDGVIYQLAFVGDLQSLQEKIQNRNLLRHDDSAVSPEQLHYHLVS